MKKQLLSHLWPFLVKAQQAFLSKICNLKFLTPLGFRRMAFLLLLIPCLAKAQYVSDHARNLNLVYFIPNDNPAIPDYERRISEFMLWLQDYYGKEMEKNGYGYKTFGLLKDDAAKRVKITLIQGKLGKESYGYDAGAPNVKSEVDAYYAAHPDERQGEHFLILLPHNPSPTGVPFFGTGKTCYAKDIADIDMSLKGTSGWIKWAGGLAHELGHGLNLPHNRQKESENATLGMALMWAGNSTLGKSATFLTATDCAILNTNQIFNKDTKTYYGAVNSKIKTIHPSYSSTKGAIVVSGKFTTDTPVNSVVFYNDPNSHDANMVYEGTGVNHDYNAITWETKTIAVDSFHVEMPISDLALKDDATPYELKVKLVHANGTIKETIYTYNFVNGIPVLDFGTKEEISKTGWTATTSSQQATSSALLIDGDPATSWHSQWSTPPAATYPHTITIDLGKLETLYGYTIVNTFRRAIKNAEILYSTDGVNFTSLGDFVIPKSTDAKDFEGAPLTFRYFKIIAKSSWDGEQFAQIGEIGFYKEQDIEPTVAITSPANGASIALGTNINITANANDIGGTVSKVEFFNGATKLGEDLTAPYSYNWTNVPSGQYALTAKVTDNSGATSISNEVVITVKALTNLLSAADSYVRDGGSTTANFGTQTALTVKKDAAGFNRITYLKFNLGQYQTDNFDVAKLKLTVQTAGTGSPSADYQLWYCSNDTWTETGLNWNNKPAQTTLLATQKGKAAGNVLEWDIKNQLKAEINGDKILTLAIVSLTQGSAYDLTLNSKEAAGDISLKPQIITDSKPQVALTSPANEAVINQGDPLTLSATATDDRGVSSVKFFIDGIEKATVTQAPYTWISPSLPLGSYVITAKATDASGLVGDAVPVTITVKDLTPPVIDCPENIQVTNDQNQCGANVSFAATATDNLSDASITYSPETGSLFPIGSTIVTATATDAAGNTSTCSFYVTVTDNTAPTIVCPGNIVLTACQATAEWPFPVTNDNCPDVILTQTDGPASGSTFANGTTTTISYEVKDAGGNISNCSFTVTRQSELDLTVTNSNPQLYYGYSLDQSTTIAGIPTGGTAPYTFSITMDRPLKSNIINSSGDEIWLSDTNSVTATLMETAIFTVTVTDANGCSVSKTTTVNAEDARCIVGNNTKIKIYHQTGNSQNPCNEICVAQSAVQAHLDHGDSLSPCTSSTPNSKFAKNEKSTIESASFDVKVYPNPSNNQFTLVVEGASNEKTEVIVYDMLARMVKRIEKNNNQPIVFGQELSPGQYLTVIKQGNDTKVVNLIKL
ncbi:Por secretion system C-terminal sorting domain-containing protein [Flavobacterium fluvii]|uniref:Por secretion system C-terminal sorting domain-containing protein n=1 Tax=Flavobacterium fluvii TaxID=468056 RepID=A0A1M5JX75_9FLAO|nr:Ig-like domain-containing protein [Flavobacterium fluvii]SHG44839.1 Por secretion system C-terminal sorting domain-containing protein [Flavobacterium fluvii]